MARLASCCCLGLAGEEVTATAEGCCVVVMLENGVIEAYLRR